MKTQTWRRINREDLGEVPDQSWEFVDKLLEILNPTFEETSDLVNRAISFEDNLNAAVITLSVAQDTEVQVKVRLSGKAIHAILTFTAFYEYARLKWRVVDQTTVAFSVKWDTAPTEPKLVRVVFFGG